ncbi:hypothetical protein DFP91_5294 [Pseudorhodoplanes sinuspersici]|uniref:Uncharacterized protein n=2 Tax=Pseudorhodoplanes sinuspersici TaxID=1235591 RepID=A0A1W6ZSJ2_9HYPH|nr:hypothetical protein CAK95_15450 [Pseudorhodoplanes sinuspersici]RKE67529.1 hypothetical protein DFP91_5294 [Pseudorhodoplanes sinuspersici]
MKAAMRAAMIALPLFLPLSQTAQAQVSEEDIEVGTNLVCDTESQVEMFVTHYDGDAQTAINEVNQEAANPTACVVATTAYMRGPDLATARSKGLTYRIAKIVVFGVVTESGLEATKPAVYYSLFKVDEIEV